MIKKLLLLALSSVMLLSSLTGCALPTSTLSTTSSTTMQEPTTANLSTLQSGKTAKYVFMFIGDGMSSVQLNAATIYLNRANNTSGSVSSPKQLEFTKFPSSGSATTFDSTSFCPDSASTSTAYSSGIKTISGTLGMGNSGTNADKSKTTTSIAELFKGAGKKVGLISSVSLDHATPAAYYAHVESRGYAYQIQTQLANSGIDYFAGGGLLKADKPITDAEKDNGYKARDDKNDSFAYLASKGYTVTNTKDAFNKVTANTGKVFCQAPKLQDSNSIVYALDANKTTDITLTEFVKKGIEVLDNDKGFFMMVESGKVDWACHANDAKAAIEDILEFDNSVKEALKFYEKYPNDTIIIVTGDHETGGMTIGQATTGYDTAFSLLENQKISYVEFDNYITKNSDSWNTLGDVMPYITANFGLTANGDTKNGAKLELSKYQQKKLEDAFAALKKGKSSAMSDEEWTMLYGGYNPLSVTVTHLLNNKAGIGWTSYSHTGVNVPVYAKGVGEELFNGSYDNTDVFKKLVEITKIK